MAMVLLWGSDCEWARAGLGRDTPRPPGSIPSLIEDAPAEELGEARRGEARPAGYVGLAGNKLVKSPKFRAASASCHPSQLLPR